MNTKYSYEDALTWYEDYKNTSISVASIAKKYSIRLNTVNRVLKRFGFPLRPSGFRPGNLFGVPGEDESDILRRKYQWLYKFAYGRRARRKGIPFLITLDQFISIVTASCFYCDTSHEEEVRNIRGHRVAMLSVDRLDSDLGYTMDNCVPCCKVCNTMKMDTPLGQFFNKIRKIHQKHCS